MQSQEPPKSILSENTIENTENYATKPTLTPGSDGEHYLQKKYDTEDRANTFYNDQVLIDEVNATALQNLVLQVLFVYLTRNILSFPKGAVMEFLLIWATS